MANLNAGSNARKSRAHHERAGTYRKDRHEAVQNPEPPPGRPAAPPVALGEVEQGEWERMLVRLEQSQSLSVVDDGAIYQYCRLYGETEAIADQQDEAKAGLRVLEENLDVKPENPEERLSPADIVQLFGQIVMLRKLISKCTDQLRQGRMALRQYLVEFGLTPASRGRVKLPAKQEAIDEFTAFQQKRTG
jgi:P27 family predicted phage terminase small subunit